jgi:hypothetical protein
VEVEGLISGSVGAHEEYPPYNYSDRIGAKANFTVEFAEDSIIPIIDVPSRVPEGDVQPLEDVKVSVNVTDVDSGVKNVTLLFSVDNGTTWENRTMNYNESTSLYEAAIPGQEAGTFVRFKIVAYDWAGNNATRDGTELYCTYQVIPEFPPSLILPLFIILATLIILCIKKKENLRKTNSKKHIFSVFLEN